jgi:hypothetical protein
MPRERREALVNGCGVKKLDERDRSPTAELRFRSEAPTENLYSEDR